MKNKKVTISLIILLTIIIVILTIFFIKILTSGTNFINIIPKNYTTISKKISYDKTFENNFNEINITSNMSDIEIKNTNSDEIRVKIYSDKENFLVNSSENLTIEETSKTSCTIFCFNKITKIEVYLPNDYKNKLNITDKYGDIDIANLENSINISSDYGDVNIKKLGKGNINVKSGDINIGSAKDINIKNNFGDITINKVTSYINIVANYGDIEINKLNIDKDSYIKNDYGDIEINKTNEIYIDAKTDLGDTDINKNYRNSNVTLSIKNNCGDIEVN